MTIQYLYQTEYVVSTEVERDTNWPQYSRVRCLDTGKNYILVGTSWIDHVTKIAVEAVLTGEISSHTHAGGGGGLSHPQVLARSLGC